MIDRIIGKIQKYPVLSERCEYKVTIASKYVVLGEYEFQVKIYVKNTKTGKFKRVRKTSYGWMGYDRWRENLVELASKAVSDYEDDIAEEIAVKERRARSIRNFENWDGKVVEVND